MKRESQNSLKTDDFYGIMIFSKINTFFLDATTYSGKSMIVWVNSRLYCSVIKEFFGMGEQKC